jgi:hypothetical protein
MAKKKTVRSLKDATEIRDRLTIWLRGDRPLSGQPHATDYAIAKALGIDDETVRGWFQQYTEKVHTPQTTHFIALARNKRFGGVSLDWLLLGHGSPQLSTTPLGDSLSAQISAALLPQLQRLEAAATSEEATEYLKSVEATLFHQLVSEHLRAFHEWRKQRKIAEWAKGYAVAIRQQKSFHAEIRRHFKALRRGLRQKIDGFSQKELLAMQEAAFGHAAVSEGRAIKRRARKKHGRGPAVFAT